MTKMLLCVSMKTIPPKGSNLICSFNCNARADRDNELVLKNLKKRTLTRFSKNC